MSSTGSTAGVPRAKSPPDRRDRPHRRHARPVAGSISRNGATNAITGSQHAQATTGRLMPPAPAPRPTRRETDRQRRCDQRDQRSTARPVRHRTADAARTGVAPDPPWDRSVGAVRPMRSEAHRPPGHHRTANAAGANALPNPPRDRSARTARQMRSEVRRTLVTTGLPMPAPSAPRFYPRAMEPISKK